MTGRPYVHKIYRDRPRKDGSRGIRSRTACGLHRDDLWPDTGSADPAKVTCPLCRPKMAVIQRIIRRKKARAS